MRGKIGEMMATDTERLMPSDTPYYMEYMWGSCLLWGFNVNIWGPMDGPPEAAA